LDRWNSELELDVNANRYSALLHPFNLNTEPDPSKLVGILLPRPLASLSRLPLHPTDGSKQRHPPPSTVAPRSPPSKRELDLICLLRFQREYNGHPNNSIQIVIHFNIMTELVLTQFNTKPPNIYTQTHPKANSSGDFVEVS
jgi:hypothetical protein